MSGSVRLRMTYISELQYECAPAVILTVLFLYLSGRRIPGLSLWLFESPGNDGVGRSFEDTVFIPDGTVYDAEIMFRPVHLVEYRFEQCI